MTGALALPVIADAEAFTSRLDQSTCNGCDRCGSRCTAGVPFARAEYERATQFLSALDRQERDRVLTQPKVVEIPGGEGATYTACRFRDVERGRCLVYGARPLICRLFGHAEWLPCPVGLITHPAEGAPELMQRYATLERHTFEEWQELDTPA
jgi:Fe-S-cluster containining protein